MYPYEAMGKALIGERGGQSPQCDGSKKARSIACQNETQELSAISNAHVRWGEIAAAPSCRSDPHLLVLTASGCATVSRESTVV